MFEKTEAKTTFLRVLIIDYTCMFACVEMKEEHVFRNYSPGEPSVRLYVKNLAKQVSEQVGLHRAD